MKTSRKKTELAEIKLEDIKPKLAIPEVRSILSLFFFLEQYLSFGKHTEGDVADGSSVKDSLVWETKRTIEGSFYQVCLLLLLLIYLTLRKFLRPARHDTRVRARTTKTNTYNGEGFSGIDNLQASSGETVININQRQKLDRGPETPVQWCPSCHAREIDRT